MPAAIYANALYLYGVEMHVMQSFSSAQVKVVSIAHWIAYLPYTNPHSLSTFYYIPLYFIPSHHSLGTPSSSSPSVLPAHLGSGGRVAHLDTPQDLLTEVGIRDKANIARL
jgi:hypothetical protein